MIPPQLCKQEFRFNLVQAKNKVAIEKAWTTEANYTYDNERLKEHLARGGNYGVLTGYDQLAVLDADTPELRAWAEQNLPLTFTVKTSKGAHFYYRIPSLKKKIVFTKNKEHFGELQFKGQYVVGPSCEHSSGVMYEIIADEEIAELSETRLEEVVKAFTDEQKTPEPNKERTQQRIQPLQKIDRAAQLKSQIRLSEVLRYYGCNTTKSPTTCPIHGDKKPSMSWDDNSGLWHCFTEDKGGDIIRMVELKENVSFKQAIRILADRYGVSIDPEPLESTEHSVSLSDEQKIVQLQRDALELLADRKLNDSTEYAVHAILLKWKIVTIRADKGDDEMYIYVEGIYEPDAKTYIKEFCLSTYGKAYTTGLVKQITDKIAARTYIKPKDFFDSAPIHYVPVKNGIVDLRNNNLIPFTPTIYFQTKIPVVYDAEATCPNIEKFYIEVLRDPQDVQVVQEFYGYCLQRDYRYPVIFMCLGTGSNGKSKHLELIRNFLGSDNCTSVTLEDLQIDQYSKAELFGKMANIAGDIGKKPIEDSSNLKALTGGDQVKANRKHLTQIVFVNYAKLVYSANELPPTYDTTEGFFRRWKILDFPHKFYKQSEYDALTPEQQEKVKLADPEIVSKLATQEEMSGLLNWALEGLKRLNKRRDFSNSKSIAEVERQWFRRSNSFYAFIEEYIEFDPVMRIIKSDLRKVFADYCTKHKVDGVSDKIIAMTLEKRGVVEKQARLPAEHPLADGDFNHRERVWAGIKWKKQAPSGTLSSTISVYKEDDEDVYKDKSQTVLKPTKEEKEESVTADTTSQENPNSPTRSLSSHQLTKTLDVVTFKYETRDKPVTDQKYRESLPAFALKIIRIMYGKLSLPTTHEDWLRQSRETANMTMLFQVSSEVFESQFDEAVISLIKNGEIVEVKPGRYVPL